MKIVLVRLREAGNVVSYTTEQNVQVGDYVILEADRGIDYGEILEIQEGMMEGECKDIIRKATEEDRRQIEKNKQDAGEALKICGRKIKEHNLPMKLIEGEYSFDRKKIVFYFTTPGRVDFRELVKDLAKIFRVRIEMRQIGVRDEARLFGGIGPCGNPLCCKTFLKTCEPVTMKMAKLQRLPLNSSKISGICGRLMCCLFFEYDTYQELAKGLPKEGEQIETPSGKGKVTAVNVLRRLVHVEFSDGRVEKVFWEK